MAAEYLANEAQNVSLNAPIIFNASIPCTRGYVYHEDGTGIFILRGITTQCYATYKVTYNGNISVPSGTAAPIAVAITVNGAERPTSKAIVSPTAVDSYSNVTSTAIIKVPRGCCFTLAVESVSAVTNDPTATPTQVISVQNSNFVVERIA